MPVIAFASLIVEAKHTTLIRDVGQSVLEGVSAIRKRFGKLPDHNLYECATTQNEPLGLHVACVSNSKMMLSRKATGSEFTIYASGKGLRQVWARQRQSSMAGSSRPKTRRLPF
jgi:hypothetical protein